MLLDVGQLLDETFNLTVIRIQSQTGPGYNRSVVETSLAGQKLYVTEDGFRAVGAKGKGLAEGKVCFLQHASAFGGRSIRGPPIVNAANGAAEFGKGFLSLVIANKLAITFEAVEIPLQIYFF